MTQIILREETINEEEKYYTNIAKDEVALLVKLLDRCNNVSGMATGFSKKKLVEYINETERWYYPLLKKAKADYPQYSNQLFLIKYHITSVLGSLKYLLSE